MSGMGIAWVGEEVVGQVLVWVVGAVGGLEVGVEVGVVAVKKRDDY